jgi:Cyclin, N-terminal domain
MNFDHSSQARSWLFDEDTLLECRNKVTRETSLSSVDASVKVKNFASGFSSRMDSSVRKRNIEGETILISDDDYNSSSNHNADSSHMTSSDQEILVRFHAHQICSLVGPDAVIPSLIRSQHVLATAIVMFRRFYLSNSVLDFKPRAMAVAAAFLASKVDDEKIKVSPKIVNIEFSNRCGQLPA